MKPGIYAPLESRLSDFDPGFAGTLAFGEYTSENFSWGIEFSNLNTDFDNGSQKNEISANSAKLILTWIKPFGRKRNRKWEIYLNIGGGIYFVDLEGAGSVVSGKESDEVYGVEVGLGGNFNLSKRFYLGLEGKYIYTTDVEVFQPVVDKFSLQGYEILGSIGVRFNFFRIFRSR